MDRFLIAEDYPVEVEPDGFRFVIPASARFFVVCRGRFHPWEGGTRVDLVATPQPSMVVFVAIMVILFMAVFFIGLWSVNPWLAIGLAVVGVCPGVLIWALGFWLTARRVRQRVNDFLSRA